MSITASHGSPRTMSSNDTSVGRRATTVLVVEDDSDFLGLCVEILNDLGWRATTADSVASARQRMDELGRCLVLCDYFLPDGTGMDLLQASSPGSHAYIFLTGHGDPEFVFESMFSGAVSVLLKPLNDIEKLDDALVEAEQRLLSGRITTRRFNKPASKRPSA